MKKVSAYTLGCKVNQYDTTAMLELLALAGYEIVTWGEFSDVYIINTCTVTNTADKKSKNIIRRAVRQSPDAFVCVCGCLAQDKAAEMLGIEGVNAVIGTDRRADIVSIIEAGVGANSVSTVTDISKTKEFEPLKVAIGGDQTRGYIKIQEGCNNFCSYCIIPYVRGRSRSRDMREIADEAKSMAAMGIKEIVLTGIHISAYGGGNGEDLLKLCNMLDNVDGIERIRLGSLESHIIDEDFIMKLKSIKKLCPHFHLSLQSGCDTVLERMNRKYNTVEYVQKVQILRKYFENPAITTDIITGFPAESKEEFTKTCEFTKNVGFARLHVFPFSEREGTPAAEMPDQLPISIRKERARQLIDIGIELEKKYLESFLGKSKIVLFEHICEEFAEGYTDSYIRVRVPFGKVKRGSIANVLLKNCKNDIIYGEINR